MVAPGEGDGYTSHRRSLLQEAKCVEAVDLAWATLTSDELEVLLLALFGSDAETASSAAGSYCGSTAQTMFLQELTAIDEHCSLDEQTVLLGGPVADLTFYYTVLPCLKADEEFCAAEVPGFFAKADPEAMGMCSNDALLSQAECEAASATWTGLQAEQLSDVCVQTECEKAIGDAAGLSGSESFAALALAAEMTCLKDEEDWCLLDSQLSSAKPFEERIVHQCSNRCLSKTVRLVTNSAVQNGKCTFGPLGLPFDPCRPEQRAVAEAYVDWMCIPGESDVCGNMPLQLTGTECAVQRMCPADPTYECTPQCQTKLDEMISASGCCFQSLVTTLKLALATHGVSEISNVLDNAGSILGDFTVVPSVGCLYSFATDQCQSTIPDGCVPITTTTTGLPTTTTTTTEPTTVAPTEPATTTTTTTTPETTTSTPETTTSTPEPTTTTSSAPTTPEPSDVPLEINLATEKPPTTGSATDIRPVVLSFLLLGVCAVWLKM